MTYLTNRILSVAALVCFLPTATGRPTDADDRNTNIFASQYLAEQSASIHDPTMAEKAIEYATKRYQDLQTEYNDMGCPETWAPFPLTSIAPSQNIDITKGNGSMTCSCGLIYGQAISQLVLLEATQVTSDGASDIVSNVISSSSITPLEAWVLSQTSHSQARCENGRAAGFPCRNVDLVAHLPLSSFRTTNTGQAPFQGNDLWGWTNAEDGREFVAWGVREGFYFMEVTGSVPRLLGFMPQRAGEMGFQHDVKIVRDVAYIGAEVDYHGVQIFDMRRLLGIDPDTDCVDDRYCQQLVPNNVYQGGQNFPVGNTHNIVVNEGSNFVYLVGGKNGCSGGLHVMDVSNPTNPRFVTCYGDDGYVHDAQCVNYRGPDSRYQTSEICFCYNVDTVTIVDVTNKSSIRILSSTSYPDFKYTHQGWLSSDQSHIVFGDEYDEVSGARFGRTRTLILDVSDLENPTDLHQIFGTTAASDHNQYVVRVSPYTKTIDMDYDGGEDYGADVIFQSNYKAGLRILQVFDYKTAAIQEIAYFDTFTFSNANYFDGAWSAYPYFRSGLVAINTVNDGFFLVKPDLGTALVGIDPPPTETPTERPTQRPTTQKPKGTKKKRKITKKKKAKRMSMRNNNNNDVDRLFRVRRKN